MRRFAMRLDPFRKFWLTAALLAPAVALAQVAPQSPASPSGNSVRGAAQTAPSSEGGAPVQSNDTRPNQNQINQGKADDNRPELQQQPAPAQNAPAENAPSMQAPPARRQPHSTN